MRFILVDSILELEPGRSIHAVKRVSKDDSFFADHFPGFPVVPGVLLTEMMAQAGGKCFDAQRSPRGKAMLARIRSAKFRKWVTPPAEVHIHAEVKSNQEQIATASCRVEVDGERMADADLLYSFLPQDRLAADYRDEVLERFLEGRDA